MPPDELPAGADNDGTLAEAASAFESLLTPKTEPAAPAKAAPNGQPPVKEPDADPEIEIDDEPAETDEGAGDNAAPLKVDPPASMTADEKAAFAQLPPPMQEFLARRERETAKGGQKEARRAQETAKQLETERKAVSERMQQLAAQAARYRPPEIQEFEGKYGDYMRGAKPFSELEKTDPMLLEFQAAKSKYDFAVLREQQAMQALQMEQLEQVGKFREAENTKLRKRVKELADDVAWEKFDQEFTNYVSTEAKAWGIQMDPNRVRSLSALEVALVRKAMLYDRAVKARAEKEKAATNGKPAPKVQRPGVPQHATAAEERLAAARNRLRKSGRTEDAAAVFEHLIQ